MGAIYTHRATGAAALSEATSGWPAGTKLKQITIHFSGAPSQDITVTLGDGVSAVYDTVLCKELAVSAVDFVFVPDEEVTLGDGDSFEVAMDDGSVTWGLKIIGER